MATDTSDDTQTSRTYGTGQASSLDHASHWSCPQSSLADDESEYCFDINEAILYLLYDDLSRNTEREVQMQTETASTAESDTLMQPQSDLLDTPSSTRVPSINRSSIRTSGDGEECPGLNGTEDIRKADETSIAGWQPSLLKKSTASAFAICLGAMLIALETLFAVSRARNGLADADSRFRYIWAYGTTGLFAVVSAFWGRLDYEVRAAAPWFRLNSGSKTKRALSLDYVDAWSIAVPFQSLRRKDYLVASTSFTALLLRVLTLLSTGIFSSRPMFVSNRPENIIITRQFVDDSTRLANFTSVIPFLVMQGTHPTVLDYDPPFNDWLSLVSAHIEYPEGVSGQFVFDTFESPVFGETELHATVDGISFGFDCEKAELERIYDSFIEVEHNGCRVNISLEVIPDVLDEAGPNYVFALSPGQFARDDCNSTSLDARRLIILWAEVEYRNTSDTEDIMDQRPTSYELINIRASVLSCAPYYNFTSVDVVRNASGTASVTSHPGTSSTKLLHIHPWDIVQACLDSSSQAPYVRDFGFRFGNRSGIGDSDFLFYPVFGSCGEACQDLPAIVDGTLLNNLITRWYQPFAALILAQAMTEETNRSATAWSAKNVDRLIMEPFPSQMMAAMLFIALIIIAYTRCIYKTTQCTRLKVSSGSILATAVLVGESHSNPTAEQSNMSISGSNIIARWKAKNTKRIKVASAIRKASQGDEQQDSRQVATSHNDLKLLQPFALRIPIRTVTCMFLSGSLIALEVLLWESYWNQGLGDAWDSRYLSLTWTAAPAAILAALGMMLSSVDSQTRILSPYFNLDQGATVSRSLKLDLLRGLVPTILLRGITTKSYVAFLTTSAALFGSTLTTASAPLFDITNMTVSETLSLQSNNLFTTNMTELSPDTEFASLILGGNISYPFPTYKDLIFPNFTMGAFSNGNENVTSEGLNSGSVVTAVVPALRPRMFCHTYTENQISSMFQDAVETATVIGPGIAVNISADESLHQDPFEPFPNHATFGTRDLRSGYFGATYGQYDLLGQIILVLSYHQFLFVYGHFDVPNVDTTALGCNATIELVDARVSLIGADLQLDETNPPQVIESSARNSMPLPLDASGWAGGLYSDLASLPAPRNTVFDTFFQQLVTSRYAIPLSSLGDPEQKQLVEDAIVFQHCISAAQAVAKYYRDKVSGLDTSNLTAEAISPPLSNSPASNNQNGYPATIRNPAARRRVVQDPIATRVLEGLLLSILVLSIAAWWLSPRKPLLPQSPTSIAAVLALLQAGDVLDHLYPPGAPEPESLEDATARLGEDCSFRLGWGPSTVDQNGSGQRYGIWVVKKS